MAADNFLRECTSHFGAPLPSADVDDTSGPLWNTVKRQLYRPEVSHVKRLVGDALIQQNRAMWDELNSLRQIMADFEVQNDELTERMKKQVNFCGSQHRDLLRRQAQMVMEDLRAQVTAAGQSLEELVPELSDEALRNYLNGTDASDAVQCRGTPPVTPSTRPPSSCGGISGCSTPDTGLPPLPLGRPLGVDELAVVADGIREALETEQDGLLALIGEQMRRFEWEENRHVSTKFAGQREPSTSELQQLVRKMQDVAMSPGMKSLSTIGTVSPRISGGSEVFTSGANDTLCAQPVTGGSSVRRLKALIAQRRKDAVPPTLMLGAVPEMAGNSEKATPSIASFGFPVSSGTPTGFDPFFDDPFE